MRKAEAAGNKDCPVKIKLVAAPLYVLTTETLDKVIVFSFSFEQLIWTFGLIFATWWASMFI